jgi:hypothetical protein
VDRVLREAVNTPYRDLVTRATGAAVRTSIELAIADADDTTTLLDFSAVGLVDFSCADEVIAKLLQSMGRASGPYVVLQGLREDHFEAIDHVLCHHQLAVLVVRAAGESPTVLGQLSDDLRAASRELQSAGARTASDLAQALGWAPDRAAEALRALAHLRLVRASGETYHPLPTQ